MGLTYTAPSSLAVTSASATQLNLTWTNGESEVPIEVQRKESGGTYQTITELDALTVSYNDTDCSANTLYYYRLRHLLGEDYSDWSTAASEYTYPATPTGLTVSFSGKTASLSWTNPHDYTYVKTYYRLSSEEAWTTDSETLSGTATSRDITVASESTSWYFRIRGYVSASGINSEYATPSPAFYTSGVMAASSLLLTSASTTSITATWDDNSSVEDGYEVYYIKTEDIVVGGESEYTLFETTAANAETSTITGLTAATEYTIRIRAKDGSYYSSYVEDTVTTGDVPDADAVIGTVTVVSQTALTVSWTCAATNEEGFTVFRSTDNSTYTEIATADADATSYADTGLDSYTAYYYKVRAYNDYGVSALSSEAHNTTTIDLDAPTALIATANSSTSITIAFTVNAGNATSHYVDRKISGGSYANIGHTAAGTTATYTDGTCSADTEYTYRIRAYNSVSAGYGDYSSPVTKKTLAVGTDTVRRNEAYFALGNVLYVASETPQTSFAAYWTSKPLDFAEADPSDANKFKTVTLVQLEYTDKYASVPIVVSLSSDGGTNWTTSTETVGSGDSTDKVHNFYFTGVTGKYITVKVSSTDDDTGFSWTGLVIHYIPRGEYTEVT